ncbi:MAG: type II toxin-antitoxin system VapC family toxin [Actinobacteria bacterium]|nr:type II toxin-antitoxin system VapC family toxin [Actinomycetota bacterium]
MEIKRLMIDTNIYIEYLRGNEQVKDILDFADIVAFGVISVGEIFTGFYLSENEKKYFSEIEEFFNSSRLLIYDVDSETAEFYAKIVSELKSSCSPIPTNDIWIAALALQHGIKLLTMDNHFKKVPGLFLI